MEPTPETATSMLPTWVSEAKDLAFSIPIIHLMICAVYLMGYHYSFGSDIVHFASVTDLFSVSLREIGPSYGSMFLIASALLLTMKARFGVLTGSEYVATRPQEDQHRLQEKLTQFRVYWHLFLLGVGGGALISIGFTWYTKGLFPFSYLSVPIALIVGGFLIWSGNRLQWSHWLHLSLMTVSYLVVVTLFRGLQAGQDDRYATFDERARYGISCSNFAILRPLSPYFLAVRRDDLKVVLDSDCKQRFAIPTVPTPQRHRILGYPR